MCVSARVLCQPVFGLLNQVHLLVTVSTGGSALAQLNSTQFPPLNWFPFHLSLLFAVQTFEVFMQLNLSA